MTSVTVTCRPSDTPRRRGCGQPGPGRRCVRPKPAGPAAAGVRVRPVRGASRQSFGRMIRLISPSVCRGALGVDAQVADAELVLEPRSGVRTLLDPRPWHIDGTVVRGVRAVGERDAFRAQAHGGGRPCGADPGHPQGLTSLAQFGLYGSALGGVDAPLQEVATADEAGDLGGGGGLVDLGRCAHLLEVAVHEHGDAVGQGHHLGLVVGDVHGRRLRRWVCDPPRAREQAPRSRLGPGGLGEALGAR